MVCNFRTHCDYLHSLKSYVPSHTFLTSYGWGQDGSANVLVNKQTKDLGVLILVGKVVHGCLFCGSSGNWFTNNSYGSLEGAKYQLTLCPPDKDIFLNEFDIASKLSEKFSPVLLPCTKGTTFWSARTRKWITSNCQNWHLKKEMRYVLHFFDG